MLSLDGKANRLATMIRNNLGAAMQGLAVVPLFAGYRPRRRPTRRKAGRIFSFDVAGGLYEETGYDAHRLRLAVRQVGAEEALPARAEPRRGGPARRRGALRRGRRRHRDRRARPDPPDLPGRHDRDRRGHPPAHRRRDRRGRRGGRRRAAWRTRAAEPPPRPSTPDRRPTEGEPPPWPCSSTPRPSRSCATARSTPARASPGAAASSCSPTPAACCSSPRTRRRALHKVSEIYDRIGFAAVGRYNEFENLRRGRRADGRPARLLATTAATSPAGRWPTRTRRPSARSSPSSQAVRGGDLRRRGRRDRRPTTSSTGSPTTARSATSRATWRWAARPRRSPTCSRRAHRADMTLAERWSSAVKALGSVGGEGGAPRTIAANQLEVAVLDRARRGRAFRRITGAALTGLLNGDAKAAAPAAEAPADGESADDAAAQETGDAKPPAPGPDKPTSSAGSADLECPPAPTDQRRAAPRPVVRLGAARSRRSLARRGRPPVAVVAVPGHRRRPARRRSRPSAPSPAPRATLPVVQGVPPVVPLAVGDRVRPAPSRRRTPPAAAR